MRFSQEEIDQHFKVFLEKENANLTDVVKIKQ